MATAYPHSPADLVRRASGERLRQRRYHAQPASSSPARATSPTERSMLPMLSLLAVTTLVIAIAATFLLATAIVVVTRGGTIEWLAALLPLTIALALFGLVGYFVRRWWNALTAE